MAAEQDSSAQASLLMLDIAAAKSALAQLQQACCAADEEHTRTKHELQTLKQLQAHPASSVYAAHLGMGSAGSGLVAQQLQALHAENLQLKACLRAEVQARQQLEQKHGALLGMLRSGNAAQLLAAVSLQAEVPGASSPHGAARALEDAREQPHPTAPVASQRGLLAPLQVPTTSSAGCSSAATTRQPLHAGLDSSSSSYSGAAAASAQHHQHGAGTAAGTDWSSPKPHAHGAGVKASSAYFPQQPGLVQQHSSQDWYTTTKVSSTLHTAPQDGAQDARSSDTASTWLQHDALCRLSHSATCANRAPACAVPPWQPQEGDDEHPAARQAAAWRQRQHEGSTQAQAGTPRAAGLGRVASDDGGGCGGCGAHHLPDDDDGGACEAASVSSSSCCRSSSHGSALLDSDDLDELAGLCDTLLQRQQQHAGAAGLAGVQVPSGLAGSAARHQRGLHGQQQELPGQQAYAPGLHTLAAQLRQLQEQVAATAQDTLAQRGGSSGAPGGLGPASCMQQHTGAPAAAPQPDDAEVAGLQHQLAMRMQEVKQRLSDICNSMLHDAGGGAAAAPQQAPVMRPAAAGGGPTAPGRGGMLSPPASPADGISGISNASASPVVCGAGAAAGMGAASSGSAFSREPSAAVYGPTMQAGTASGATSTTTQRSDSGAALRAKAAAGIQASMAAAAAAAAAGASARARAGAGARQALFGRAPAQPSVPAAASHASPPAPAPAPAPAASCDASAGLSRRAAAVAAAWARDGRRHSSRGDGADMADDSDSSWATVDEECEQQPQQQQQTRQARTQAELYDWCARDNGTEAASAGGRQAAQGDQRVQRGSSHQPLRAAQHSSPQQAPEQQWDGRCAARARDQQERQASPVSCESSMAAPLKGRLPAEVVFSPLKVSGGSGDQTAGGGAGGGHGGGSGGSGDQTAGTARGCRGGTAPVSSASRPLRPLNV